MTPYLACNGVMVRTNVSNMLVYIDEVILHIVLGLAVFHKKKVRYNNKKQNDDRISNEIKFVSPQIWLQYQYSIF